MHVEIEATNECNTRCLHCPHETITRPMGKMSWDTYQTVMDQVLARTTELSVEFAGMGEPLLNPNIYRFVGYVSARATTSLTTNASALTATNVTRLIDAGLNRLTISFNGTDKTSYELMMGGLEFERAANYLRQAIQLARGTRTQIAANVSVTKQMQKQLPAMRAYLTDTGVDHIFFSQCHNRGGNLNDALICDTPPPPAAHATRCDIFANTLFVAWNGDVLSCCHDLAGENRLGNATRVALADLLEQRQAIVARGVSFRICQGCNDMYRYMNASTPNGAPLAEWIYQLYNTADERHAYLAKQIGELTTQTTELHARVAERDAEIAALRAELNDLRASRSWRWLTRLQRVRLAIAPRASRRERVLQGLLNKAGF